MAYSLFLVRIWVFYFVFIILQFVFISLFPYFLHFSVIRNILECDWYPVILFSTRSPCFCLAGISCLHFRVRLCVYTHHTHRGIYLCFLSFLPFFLIHFLWLACCFFSYLVVSFPFVFLFNDVCACVRACVGARACTFWLYILLLLTFLIFIIPVIAISFDYFLHIYILRRDLYFTWCFWCCNYIFVWRRVIRVFYFTFILEVIMLFIMFVWLLRPHAVIYILHRIYFIYTYIYRKGLYRYSILVILRINISFLFVQYFIYIVPWSLVLVVLGLRVYIIRVYN